MHVQLQALARQSVSRACGFGTIAIVTLMVGLSDDFALALKAGGYATLLMCIILLLKAFYAEHQPYKRTELWLMLEPEERPRANVAQGIVGRLMRETYLIFAGRTALVAAVLLLGALAHGLRN